MKDQPAGKSIREILLSKRFILISASLIIVLSPLALFATSMNPLQNTDEDGSTLTMSVLGSSMKFGDYFPSNNRTINQDDQMNWYVSVHNELENSEYLAVRVKLLNSTDAIPNDMLNQPSAKLAIFDVQQLVARDSKWIIPINWTITQSSITSNSSDSGNVTRIESMLLNGEDISDINIESSNGQGFRLIFELWRYDSNAKDFVFDLPSESTTSIDFDNTKRSVWTQIWFDVKS